MVYGSMSVRCFRNVTAATTSSFRRQSSATATFSSSSIVKAPLSSIIGDDDSKNSSRKRIVLMLYRQLLRWCDETDKDIPLSQSIPPIHLSPPQIYSGSLKGLIESSGNISNSSGGVDDDDHLVPSPYSSVFSRRTSVVNKAGITIHSVPSSGDIKQIVKAVFQMNALTTDEHDKKDQVSMAFEWIKTLNELTQQLEEMKMKRRKHQNRECVNFRVGQIVKHRTLAWRGVILGWTRRTTDTISSEATSQATSLTQKSYESTNPYGSDDDDDIVYDVALDWGDATLLSSAKHPSGLKNIYQSDLTLVDDPDLMRIRSTTDQFQRFNSELQCFVPGDVLTYIYPNDRPTDEEDLSSWKSYENPSNESAENISQGIRSLAEYLRQIILGYTSAPESRKLRLLSGYLERLTKLSKGDVVPAEDRFRGGLVSYRNSESGQQDSAITQTKMKWELQRLVELAVEIEDILWTRRKALETDRSIKFSLGEYVHHKKYGFRGVVVGWDPEPAYEVTHWDGLQHIENPEQYPFYHVIPDRSDVMVAFGGERPWRYVCEENLELCPQENRDLDVDLEPEWTTDAKNGTYQPPDELLLRHGGQLEDDGVTENCLEELKNAINSIFFSIRKGADTSIEDADPEVRAILQQMSMENMFQTLKYAETSDAATVLSDAFKEIWKGHEDKDIRYKFDTGVNYLLTGKTAKALSIFGEVVDEDPTYAEAWNKAATCEFMIGNLDASMAAAQRTLEIVPDHFQALNGLGLVYNEKRDLQHARDNFRKSMELDPWSPVAPRLSVCLDTLKRWKDTSLLNVDENTDQPEWKNPYTTPS